MIMWIFICLAWVGQWYAGIVDGIKQQLGNNKRTTHNNFIYEVGQWYAAGDCRVGHWLHTFYILHLTSKVGGTLVGTSYIFHLTSKRVGRWLPVFHF